MTKRDKVSEPDKRRISHPRPDPDKIRSPHKRSPPAAPRPHAPIFAALGDQTRLALVARLADAHPRSISQLAHGSRLTRQAITKHLRVLEHAGLVRHTRAGRETLFQLDPEPLGELSQYLNRVSHHWDNAIARLKSFVEP